MRLERRVPLLWLLAGGLMLCSWCSFLSGIGGWVAGRDLARRAAWAEFSATAGPLADLPLMGVLVTRLDRAGPAARAGIQRGDMIVAINATHVQDARDLRDALRKYQSGDSVLITVLRQPGEVDVMVRLELFPGDTDMPYLGIYYTARGDEPGDL